MAQTVIKIDLLQHLEISVAGLEHTKFGCYQFQSFLIVVVIVILILLQTTFSQISWPFTGENFIAIRQGKKHF